MKHTAGLVHYVQYDDGDNAIITEEGDGRICEMITNEPNDIRDANGQRLVDCWNACEGLSDPEETISSLLKMANELKGTKKIVPQLLEALKVVTMKIEFLLNS